MDHRDDRGGSVVFVMKYPDSEGNVWVSKGRLYDRIAAALEARGIHCYVAYPELTGRPAFEPRHFEPVEIDFRSGGTPWDRVEGFVQERRVRVVVFMDFPSREAKVSALRSLGVATINSVAYSFEEGGKQPRIKAFLKWWMNRLARPTYDLHVANSRHQRETLASLYCLPPSRIRTAVNGVDTDFFAPGLAPDPREFGLPTTDFYAIAASQARPEKRVDYLIEVAGEVFRRNPDLSLTFVHVGGGGLLPRWRQAALDAGLGERFVFLGHRPEIASLYRLGTLMLHASIRESFGMAVAEAMACELPVICADRGGLREIVDHGRTGYLLEPDDRRGFAEAILELLARPDRCQELGHLGRLRVIERFSLARQVEEWCGILIDLIGSRSETSTSGIRQVNRSTPNSAGSPTATRLTS